MPQGFVVPFAHFYDHMNWAFEDHCYFVSRYLLYKKKLIAFPVEHFTVGANKFENLPRVQNVLCAMYVLDMTKEGLPWKAVQWK